jgi:hypothetical protein
MSRDTAVGALDWILNSSFELDNNISSTSTLFSEMLGKDITIFVFS